MAADEAMLISAGAGVISLRFYGWIEATASLGYFQPASVLEDSALAKLPFVRRLTGGGTLIHHHELTYALALPAEFVGRSHEAWLSFMHSIVVRVLRGRRILAQQASAADRASRDTVLCFQRWTPGDVVLAGHKVVGSAQRKQKRCLLQHGAILMQASAHVAHLKGIADLACCPDTLELPMELCTAISDELRQEVGWALARLDWTADERRERAELARHKYATAAWNEKR